MNLPKQIPPPLNLSEQITHINRLCHFPPFNHTCATLPLQFLFFYKSSLLPHNPVKQEMESSWKQHIGNRSPLNANFLLKSSLLPLEPVKQEVAIPQIQPGNRSPLITERHMDLSRLIITNMFMITHHLRVITC